MPSAAARARRARTVSPRIGVAILATIAETRTEHVLAGDPSLTPAAALADGFADALVAAAGLAALGAVLATVLVRRRMPAGEAPQEVAVEQAG